MVDKYKREILLVPRAGLCNRLRAIAAAKRVAFFLDYKLYILWTWGDYYSLFENEDNVYIIDKLPVNFRDFHYISTAMTHDGFINGNQKLDIYSYQNVIIDTCHIFSDLTLPPIDLKGLLNYFPKPSYAVINRKKELESKLFIGQRIIGIHIRRTDNHVSVKKSPDQLFVAEMRKILEKEDCIFFLCSDNFHSIQVYKKIFGMNLIIYEKSDSRITRWPRNSFDLQMIIEDYLDLLLLSSCSYVLGSYFSSYSEMAILMNGARESKIVKT